MIKSVSIKKSYHDLDVLKGIDLEIREKELVSIVGASGAGKTTLLQILGTLDRPDSGELYIDNTNVYALNDKQLASVRNKKIGFIFQFHQLLPEFTAIENVCIPAFIAKTNEKEAKDRARMLLDRLGLSDRVKHKPRQLSGGEQQRVAVARALINDPSIVLADEPSGNLDSKNAKELHELFFELREEFNQTFVIVTHNNELAKMADRMLVISDGMIVENGNT